ncbi:MAG: ComEA family DNA-binding protein, partial [Bacteroidota bacterium]
MHEVSGQIRKDKDEKIIAELMERFIENQEANLDYTDLQEQLEFYMKNKLNLNEATRAELEKLFFVSEKQVNAILKHRSLFGNFITVFEL